MLQASVLGPSDEFQSQVSLLRQTKAGCSSTTAAVAAAAQLWLRESPLEYCGWPRYWAQVSIRLRRPAGRLEPLTKCHPSSSTPTRRNAFFPLFPSPETLLIAHPESNSSRFPSRLVSVRYLRASKTRNQKPPEILDRFLHLMRPIMCVLPEVSAPDRKVREGKPHSG